MVFAVALPSPHGCLCSDEADELSLPTWHWLEGRYRPEEVRPGSLLSPARLPSSLCPASSLRPTNGTSARLCLPQPQTPAKLAGLAAFALKRRAPFWVRLKPTWQPPPTSPTTPHPFSLGGRHSGRQQPWAEGVCWIREARELGMNHSRLVSAARGEMPSLPGCLSNKLAITGLGLRVNSMLLLFFHPRLLMRGGCNREKLRSTGSEPASQC